ncbi:MAG: serine/threonine protein phosphatase [Lachnospiraceae bacterium]|nr:serine/threonine protein phosphatase [Lachnospiraceae bacterium]
METNGKGTIIEELRKQQIEAVRLKRAAAKRKRRKRLWILVPCLLLLLLAAYVGSEILANRHFEITRYFLESEKVDTPVKIAVLSDLHSMEYGTKNSELIEAIRTEQPDFIAMIGDMVNDDDTDFTVIRELCRALREIAPVYYTLGNHEGTLMYSRLDQVALDEMLTEDGVKMLINEVTEFQKGNTTIRIAGISNEAAGYEYWAKDKMEAFWEMDGYKLVLSHFPDLYDSLLKDATMDLALAGHYHGGLIRLPGLGGIYHPATGFFPQHAGGQYSLTNGTLIVSRGIGGHGGIPRINNRPELVIIEIH